MTVKEFLKMKYQGGDLIAHLELNNENVYSDSVEIDDWKDNSKEFLKYENYIVKAWDIYDYAQIYLVIKNEKK